MILNSEYRHQTRAARSCGAVLLGATVVFGMFAVAPSVFAATTGDNQTHDPSRMIECDGRFYVYSTGGTSKSSANGLDWTSGPSLVRDGFPAWVDELLASDNQGLWAPGIVHHGGRYLVYFSVCGLPAAGAPCAIGLLTSPTLDPSAPNFGWADGGLVVTNPRNTDEVQYAAIDGAPIVDPSGDLWLVWGSGYGKDQSRDQLYVTRLDNETGLPLESDSAWNPPSSPGYPLKTGRREGPYMHYRDGYYYLFWNEGSCCSGTASDYVIWVSRSTSITGPFTGDRVFFASVGDIHADRTEAERLLGAAAARGGRRSPAPAAPESGAALATASQASVDRQK